MHQATYILHMSIGLTCVTVPKKPPRGGMGGNAARNAAHLAGAAQEVGQVVERVRRQLEGGPQAQEQALDALQLLAARLACSACGAGGFTALSRFY